MKKSGKSGLIPYTCDLWLAKRNAVHEYHTTLMRSRLHQGVSPTPRNTWFERATANTTVQCSRYKPAGTKGQSQCRYFFLETCLLRFPKCAGRCDDYLPEGDQRS